MDQNRTTLPDILEEGLNLVIVGFNPSLVSWETGHHYANPVNNFYRLLFQAGLTPYLLKPQEDVLLPGFGIGLTNLVQHIPSAAETTVPASIYRSNRKVLEEKISGYKPLIVCFNGLKLYDYFFGIKIAKLGIQDETIEGIPLFVCPSSSGAANKYFKLRQELYNELKLLLDNKFSNKL